MDEIKAQKKALKKAYKKAKRKTVLGWKILTILCAILMVVFIPLCTILNTFDNTVAAFVGGTFWKLENEDPNAQYFTTDFSSPEEMVDYGLTVAQQVEAEGAALLMNNGALPLAKDAEGQHLLLLQRQPRLRRHRLRQYRCLDRRHPAHRAGKGRRHRQPYAVGFLRHRRRQGLHPRQWRYGIHRQRHHGGSALGRLHR